MTEAFTEFDLFAQMDNFQLAWRRLTRSIRYDVKDWLGLQIYAWPDHLERHLDRLIEQAETYQPSASYSLFRPKNDRSLRQFTFLSMDDRLIYQALGNRVIAQSFEEISSWADSNRIFGNIPLDPMDNFVFKRTFTSKHPDVEQRVIGQYDLFRNEILGTRAGMLESFESPWLIKTDVSSFYPSIQYDKLLTSLSNRGWLRDERLINLLQRCLKKWSYSQKGQGLPIGYETSDHLANLYLIPLDETLAEFGVKRYVDDIYIFTPSFLDAKRAIVKLDSCLTNLGLQRNGGKTEFLCLREVSEENLLSKLSRSLSFLAQRRIQEKQEIRRQQKLKELFSENYQPYDDIGCQSKAIKDIRTVAFSVYRINFPYEDVRNAALHILDHYPGHSFHAIEYLTTHYIKDYEVTEKLRNIITHDFEPVKLRLDCLKGLVKRKGFRFFEKEVLAALENDDWYIRYVVLRDIAVHQALNLGAQLEEAIRLISHNDNNPLVRAFAIRITFLFSINVEEKRDIVNAALRDSDMFIKILGIQLASEFNIQDVQNTHLSHKLRKRYIDPKIHNEIEEFHTIIQELFQIRMDADFPIETVFDNFDVSLQLLKRILGTKDQGVNDFVKTMYSFTLMFLNGIVAKKSPDYQHIDNLETLVKNVFSETPVRKDVIFLIDCWDKVNQGINLTNGQQTVILDDLKPVFQFYIRDLHYQYFGVPMRDEIFISYSHKDEHWRESIQKHLKPYFREKSITVWDDKKIKPGENWDKEITNALQRAKVAILLVSSDFLASDYIYDNELPPIFDAAGKEGLVIVWIAVRPSAYKTTSIAKIQCAHDNPDLALSDRDGNVDAELVKIGSFVASLF